jgi:cell division protein FtsW
MSKSMEIFRPFGFDKPLFLATLALILIGLIMVFSSSGVMSSDRYGQPFHFFIHQIIGAGLGLILVLGISWVRKPFYQNANIVYALLILTLFLLALSLIMPAIGKTNRWIAFMGLRFQPSELAKISLILFFAYYLDRKKDKLNEPLTLLFPLAILLLFLLLIIKEPDYGTAMLLFLIAAIMLFIAGVRFKYFLALGITAIGFFAFYLFQASYRLERVHAILSPTDDPQGASFQIIQSKLAVGSGGLFGVNIGQSSQKLFFLPCAHTDYIYAIVGEELGLLGTMVILLLFLVILWRGLLISWKSPSLISQMTAAGLTLAIFLQAMLNISIVLGLGPPTGFPLPLISYGRSSLISTLFSIGILLHISQRKGSSRRKK